MGTQEVTAETRARVAEILHRDMVALRVGARPWAEQPEGYRITVMGSKTVTDVINAVLSGESESS